MDFWRRALDQARRRAAEADRLPPEFRGAERQFWATVLQHASSAQQDAARPRCRCGKVCYRSEAVARVAAQVGSEAEIGSRLWSAYACGAAWHVGHDRGRPVTAVLSRGYEYQPRQEVTYPAEGDPVDLLDHAGQVRAALAEADAEAPFRLVGVASPVLLWPSRLVLRIPVGARPPALSALRLGCAALRLGPPKTAPLRPAAYVVARIVVVRGADGEAEIGEACARVVARWGCGGEVVVGRRRVLRVAGLTLTGYEVGLALDERGSLIALSEGVGVRRNWGCGVFAAAE